MEVVKQGSAAIGLRSKTHVVLASVNKAQSELSSYQKKIFKVEDDIGVAIAGLTADGCVLSHHMGSKYINYSYTYESPLLVGRLVVQLADKAQGGERTEQSVNRMMTIIDLAQNIRERHNKPLKSPLKEMVVVHPDAEFLDDIVGKLKNLVVTDS